MAKQFKKGDIVRYQDPECAFFVAVTKISKNTAYEFAGVVIASKGSNAPPVGNKSKDWDEAQFAKVTVKAKFVPEARASLEMTVSDLQQVITA